MQTVPFVTYLAWASQVCFTNVMHLYKAEVEFCCKPRALKCDQRYQKFYSIDYPGNKILSNIYKSICLIDAKWLERGTFIFFVSFVQHPPDIQSCSLFLVVAQMRSIPSTFKKKRKKFTSNSLPLEMAAIIPTTQIAHHHQQFMTVKTIKSGTPSGHT